MNIYTVRHGETESNKKGLYYGSTDVKLNKKGIYQAEKLKHVLKNIKFDVMYSSEKSRAVETAGIIKEGSLKDFSVDARINEMNFGDFENKDYNDIKKLYPKLWKKWCRDWKNTVLPGGESYIHFYSRVKSFMEDLLRNDKAENVLVVTHSGVIRCIYCLVMDDNPDMFWKFASHNGDFSIIKYEYNNLYIDSIICLDKLNNII